MSDLWETHTILRKKHIGKVEKKLEQSKAMRTGNYEIQKKKNFNNTMKKLDDTNENKSHTKFGQKRARLLQEARIKLGKDQKQMSNFLAMDNNEYKKYESGNIIPEEKKLILFEKKLKLKLRGKEETWK